VCFYWNSHAVAWHGAASPEDFRIRSNHLMYYEIMKDAAGKGIHWFDMNPSGGNRGVVEFKEHLGTVKLQSRIVVRRSGMMRLLGGVRHLVRSSRQH
jgi:lipid II:glycine glycyltransferase (peptidoglycan interpeptide bridge formation enzyme)